jgi:hypothetical protein
MVHPVRRGAAGMEGVLHLVGLQVVGCRLAVLDVEQAPQGGPQGEDELGPRWSDVMTAGTPNLLTHP